MAISNDTKTCSGTGDEEPMALVRREENVSSDDLPVIFAGHATPAVAEKVRKFYFSVADIFEAWV